MILAFDIETVPNFEFGRVLYELDGIADAEVTKAMFAARRVKAPMADWLPLHQQKIVAISVVVRWNERGFLVKSLGSAESDEKELIEEFFRAIERLPTLVSWNGGGFDLPVINYRALFHGVRSPTYWSTGENNQQFRYNNYQNRFHKRHTDLMDVLAGYRSNAVAGLDEVSKLIGLPGKIGIGGDKILDTYYQGKFEEIRNYCDVDALNTYLIYIRFQLIEGKYTNAEYQRELELAKQWLGQCGRSHLTEYLTAWN